ncbi:hypothetical protein BCR32DRAFT_291113 [Anaeromyces robustus]|uniref:Uncharacterized protein n=1 Tax=Anaeromyces robustus TaxID=1754192 RepID=A0A1Y1XGC4_9FUNG|nr:hypothetical protein BCR32DRAFT_291113 [Anaeromyces robustus]|eukprot:ORX84742.1 hypothetical protein BCR32DRAFT_291113 [Anaeromyces robustus]
MSENIENKVEEVNEEVNVNEKIDINFGKKGGLLNSLALSLFNEGIDNNILMFLRIIFGLLFASLLALLIITKFSIHIIILLIITGLLFVTLEWWMNEMDIVKEFDEEEEEEEEEEENENQTEEKKTK